MGQILGHLTIQQSWPQVELPKCWAETLQISLVIRAAMQDTNQMQRVSHDLESDQGGDER